MDQVTQRNAAMVEQSTVASRSLARESEELGRLTAQFNVHDPASAEDTAGKVVALSRRPRTA